jgi:hypothetical protein
MHFSSKEGTDVSIKDKLALTNKYISFSFIQIDLLAFDETTIPVLCAIDDLQKF